MNENVERSQKHEDRLKKLTKYNYDPAENKLQNNSYVTNMLYFIWSRN